CSPVEQEVDRDVTGSRCPLPRRGAAVLATSARAVNLGLSASLCPRQATYLLSGRVAGTDTRGRLLRAGSQSLPRRDAAADATSAQAETRKGDCRQCLPRIATEQRRSRRPSQGADLAELARQLLPRQAAIG